MREEQLDGLRAQGVIIGENVTISEKATIDKHGQVIIGDGCLIAPFSFIFSHRGVAGGKPRGFPSRNQVTRPGKNVTIAVRALVLGGLTIGDESIVAAGAVVTHDVPPGVVVAGNPAVQIDTVDNLRVRWDDKPHM